MPCRSVILAICAPVAFGLVGGVFRPGALGAGSEQPDLRYPGADRRVGLSPSATALRRQFLERRMSSL